MLLGNILLKWFVSSGSFLQELRPLLIAELATNVQGIFAWFLAFLDQRVHLLLNSPCHPFLLNLELPVVRRIVLGAVDVPFIGTCHLPAVYEVLSMLHLAGPVMASFSTVLTGVVPENVPRAGRCGGAG